MKRIEKGPCCVLAYIENGQGRRVVAAGEGRHDNMFENPATLANNKKELDCVVRILGALREELPDE